jgi:hypothetical protein
VQGLFGVRSFGGRGIGAMSDLDTEAGLPVVGGRSHEAIHERLPEYVTIAALGREPATELPDVAAHLAHCADCRERLAELLAMTAAAYAGEVAPAPHYPELDLGFLHPVERVREQAWWIDEARRVVIDFSQALLDLPRPSALAGTTRGQLLYRYEQAPGSLMDLELVIEVFADDGDQQSGWVRVSVEVPSCDPLDQPPTAVGLHAKDLGRTGTTDETGIVDFAAVPLAVLPTLRVTVDRQCVRKSVSR